MKRFAAVVCCVIVLLSIVGLFAQEAERWSVYYKVYYFKVAPEKNSEFMDLVKTWKPVEEEFIKQKVAISYNLYSVSYPRGKAQEYTHVWVDAFTDFKNANKGYSKRIKKAAYPNWTDEQWDEFDQKVNNTRDIIKIELWHLQDYLNPIAAGKYLQVNYMKVPPGGGGEYLSVARDIWKPYHQAKQDAGYMGSWLVESLLFPQGTAYPYNYGTIDFFNNIEDIVKNVPDEVLKKAHPDETKWDSMWERTRKSRDLVKRELWILVDYAIPEKDQ